MSLCAGALGCGGGDTSPASSKRALAAVSGATTTTGPSHKVKYDRDLDTDTFHHDTDTDGDARYGRENLVNRFGHAASGAQRRAIVTVVQRYHAATAAKDGNKACAELIAGLAKGLAEQAPPGQSAANRCGAALDETLAHLAGATDAGQADVHVIAVHVQRDQARVRVRLPTGEDRYVPLTRQGRTWKIDTLFDMAL